MFRAPCYAPVDIELLWTNATECCAVWQSVNPVLFADGTTDYLGIIVYHDNDIASGTYSTVGTVIQQGQIFNRTGTGGNVTGDHVHLETGKGQITNAVNLFHFLDNTSCRRIVPDSVLYVNDTYVTQMTGYNWIEYQGGHPQPILAWTRKKFPWVLYARKLRKRRKRLF